MHLERSVTIARAPAEVFTYIRDPNNDPTWCPTVLESRQVVGAGPDVGAEYQQRHKPGPGPASDLHVRIVEVDAPRLQTVRSTDDLGYFDVTYRLEELPDGSTRLTQSDDIHFAGVKRLLLPIIWLAVNTGVKRQFAELRRRLTAERSPTTPPAGGS